MNKKSMSTSKFFTVFAALVALMLSVPHAVHADDTVAIHNEILGSGVPGQVGSTDAKPVMDDIYHAPQYLPGTPTAATIYPRVMDVECTQVGGMLNCKGYHWTPDMGRAEYLMIRPRIIKPAEPTVITVIKEVPVKKGLE